MCVIIYKPVGVELPSLDILDKAHGFNPHGCGLCSPTVTYKGLSYNSFKHALSFCSKDEPLLIHFRYATHGSIKKSNCHPFFDKDTDTFFMHNGVLPIQSVNDRTDSEIMFRQTLVPIIKRHGFTYDVSRAFEYYANGSRFAFLHENEVHLIGSFIEYQGLFFSNLRFL